MKPFFIVLFLTISFLTISAQGEEITQTIKGVIVDKDAQIPLIGVNIAIKSTSPLMGAVTDIDGVFKIEKVPLGRHQIEITYLGYEPVILNSLLLKSGKELELNIEMIESTETLNEVVVSASSQMDKSKAINEFATVSARTFSVEETGRYATSGFDPSRMAQNYAGVSTGSSSDLNNEIIIRGNSPSGVLWRLEGIEIPNPNHFSAMGNSGGAISMLSSSTLTNSDFYTAAFPSEFGNATSGVFDLSLRNGNYENREYSFMLGALGIELAAEGPIDKQARSSYIFNYRYSTLAVLEAIQLNPTGDILPKYQDLSFKLNIPTKKAGVFSLFGLGGSSLARSQPTADSSQWNVKNDRWGFKRKQTSATIGLSNKLLITDKSYLKTVAVFSHEDSDEDNFWLDESNEYQELFDQSNNAINNSIRFSSTYSHKFNARNTFRSGLIFSHNRFNFKWDGFDEGMDEVVNLFENNGNASLFQSFVHWKYRVNKSLVFNTGLHYTRLLLNQSQSIEPRVSMQWNLNAKNTISFASGLHSKMEQIGVYLFEGVLPNGRIIKPRDHLGLTKSFHNVIGFDRVLQPNLRLKVETYYQFLFNIPIENEPGSARSTLNSADIWDAIRLGEAVAEGEGRNIGIDITLEKFFDRQYYFLVTGSLYDSRYSTIDGEWYNTRFNGNYQFNILGGKEFNLGKNKKNILGVNGKFTLSGGSRYTPIDLIASQQADEQILINESSFALRSGTYYRFDFGVSYKINTKKMTHTLMVDFQNITNRKNVGGQFYDSESHNIEFYYQAGFFPTFNYRIEW